MQGRAEDFVILGGQKEGRSPLGPQLRPAGPSSQDTRDGVKGKGCAGCPSPGFHPWSIGMGPTWAKVADQGGFAPLSVPPPPKKNPLHALGYLCNIGSKIKKSYQFSLGNTEKSHRNVFYIRN